MRYWLKECPRCRGDLHEEWDIYGRFIACIQCGYILKESQETLLLMSSVLRQPDLAEKVA